MYKFFGHFQFLNSSGCSHKAETHAVVISVKRAVFDVFDFETRVEIVKNPLFIVHAIFTILDTKLTYNKKV